MLRARIEAATVGIGAASTDDLPGALVAGAEMLLSQLNGESDAAIDLLAADALITYALEAASEAGGSVEHVATAAMKRISAMERESEG